MENMNKKNNDLNQKRNSYFKLSDEEVIANFLQSEVLEDKKVISLKDGKKGLSNCKEDSISQDTMAYKINKSGFFLELLKEKENSLQLIGN